MNQQGAIGHGSPWQKLVAVVALVLLPLGQANATTVTSATLDGSVNDLGGAAVVGATISVVHEPTGQTKTLTAGDNGNFYQSGLRVGGPYTITVTAPGYRDAVAEDIFLRAGDNQDLRLRLSRADAMTEEVVVTAQRISGRDLNNGVGSFFNEDDIANQPATQRDVIRTLLRDPLAASDGEGNLSVGGVNPRFNGLAIDGALQQDDFGLSSSTYATSRSPINLDAIESATLTATDYSVIVSGFTGGLVNVTTKSGTNEFDGSAFYYYQDQDFLGEDFNGGSITNPEF
ncbi:MAG: TonB-dependent receptor, partial [Pseudomonadales bacterium]|nr:TonB-dependent receptor [Pseudomonadales bacterium]